MNIDEILSQDAVLPDLKAKTNIEVFVELAAPLHALRPELHSVDVVSILIDREKLGSTAVGEGIAIPHGRVSGLSQACLAVGRSIKGIDFFAPDGQPCHIFFLILMMEHGAGQQLRLLAQIARRAKEPVFRRKIDMAANASQLWQAIIAP